MALKAIRGGTPEQLAKARVLECRCGSRTVIEARVGVAIDKKGRTVHRGTLVRICLKCREIVE